MPCRPSWQAPREGNVSWTPGNITTIGYAADNAVDVASAWLAATGPTAQHLTLEAAPAPPGTLAGHCVRRRALRRCCGRELAHCDDRGGLLLDAGAAGVLADVHDGDPLIHEAHQGDSLAIRMELGRLWLQAGLFPGTNTLLAAGVMLAALTTIPVL